MNYVMGPLQFSLWVIMGSTWLVYHWMKNSGMGPKI